MIRIAYVQIGVPKTNYQRNSFFNNVKVQIQDMIFSFNDLENGILRKN